MTTPDPSPRWTPETAQLVTTARRRHTGTVVDWVGKRYGWRCSCDEGDGSYASPMSWEGAADALHEHENDAILTALADAGLLLPPGGETRVEWGEALPGCVPDVVWRDPARADGWEATHLRTVHVGPWEVTDGE